MEIKDLIKTRRLQRGMTMRELAEKIGVSEATVSRWEAGHIKGWRWDRAKAISDARHCYKKYIIKYIKIQNFFIKSLAICVHICYSIDTS